MLDKLTKEFFDSYLNETFLLDADGQAEVPLVLTSVTALPAHPMRRVGGESAVLREQGFVLVFRGPNRPALPQRMYNLQHEKLGKIEMMFLVPVAEDKNGRFYEAVFN